MEPSDPNISLEKSSRKGTEKSSNPPQNPEEVKESREKLSISSGGLGSMTESKKIYEKISDLYELNKVTLEKNRNLALAFNILKKETNDANTLRRQLESKLDKKIKIVDEKVENVIKDVNNYSAQKKTSESDLNFVKNKCKQLEKKVSAIEEAQNDVHIKEYIAESILTLVNKFEGLEKKLEGKFTEVLNEVKKNDENIKKTDESVKKNDESVKKSMLEMEIRQEKLMQDKLEAFELKIFQQLEKMMSHFNYK